MSTESSDHGFVRRWQAYRKDSARGGPAGSGKRRRLFILLAIVLALGGAIVALLRSLQTTPDPYFLTISIREYKDARWPTNSFAVQDGKALLRHFPEEQQKLAFNSQTRSLIIRELKNLPNDSSFPVVVHLCAYAVCDRDEVYLLPAEATPGDMNVLSLKEVLQNLRSNKSRHKLLLLDIMRPLADDKLGILKNDVAAKVHALLKKLDAEKELPLLVICACSADEESLVFEEAQMSAFAYYLDRGLSGFADGFGSEGSKQGRITVKELAAFVAEHVDAWARIHRNTRQRPILFGNGRDFALAKVPAETPEKNPLPKEPRPYPKWLKEAWELRDSWEDDHVFRISSLPFKQLEYHLLRAEQRWRGGIEPKRIEQDLAFQLNDIKRQVQQAKLIEMPPPRSLALALNPVSQHEEKSKDDGDKGEKPAADPATVFADLLAQLDAGAVKDEERPKVREEFWKNLENVPFEQTAHIIFSDIANKPLPTEGQVQMAAELLADKENRPQYVETLLLQRLDELRKLVERNGWNWSEGGAVGQCLQATREATRAVAKLAAAPYALPWVEQLFEQADRKRQAGEKVLFQERFPAWPQATHFLKIAEQDYREIQGRIEILKNAFEDYTDALLLLPGQLPYLTATPQLPADLQRQWRRAVVKCKDLALLLEARAPDSHDSIEDARIALRSHLIYLTKSFQKEYEALRSDKHLTAQKHLQLQALLESCEFRAAQREQLLRLGHRIALKLNGRMLQWERGNANSGGISLPFVAAEAVTKGASGRAERRAALSLELLDLAGAATSELENQLAEVKTDTGANWQILGEALRLHWTEKLNRRYLSLENKLPAAMRLSFLSLPVKEKHEWKLEQYSWSHDPSAQWRRNLYNEFTLWLGKRYQAEHQAFSAWSSGVTFFATAAKDYLR